MDEKVEENKRVKVSDRSVGSTELFKNKNLSPTVGAGGQYQVQVEQPQQSAFSRLAEGLSTMNTALQAVGESDIAASDQAIQKASEMTLEQAQAAAVELKDAEDGMYKSGGFVDRLTRRGEVSNTENFLNFPRAQRALGHKLGAEGYTKRATMELKAAQEAFKTQGTEYDAAAIMEGIRNDMGEEFGMDDSFSTKQGFDNAVGKFTAEQISRDFDQKNKVSRVHNITRASDEMSAIFAGHATSSDEQLSTRLSEMAGRYNNLTVGDSAAAMRMALSTLADRDPLGAQRAINMQRDGVLRDINMGGVPISSAAFEATRDAIESELESIERKAERKSEVSDAKVTKSAIGAKQGVGNLDFEEGGHTLLDLGLDPESISAEEAAVVYTSAEDMQDGVDRALLNGATLGKKGVIRAAISGFDSNKDNRDNNKAIQQANNTSRHEQESSVITKIETDDIRAEMVALRDSKVPTKGIRSIHNKGYEERKHVGRTGKLLDGTPVIIDDIPYLLAGDPAQQAWNTTHAKNSVAQQDDLITKLKAEQDVKSEKLLAEANNNATGSSVQDKVRASYDSLVPRDFINKQIDDNYTHSLARSESNTEEDFVSDRQMRHPINRSKGIAYIDSINKAKRNRAHVKIPGLAGAFITDAVDFASPLDIDKLDNLAVLAMEKIGMTMDELRTLGRGSMVIGVKSPVVVTEEVLSKIPIRGASEVELKEAVTIINDEFNSNVTIQQLKKAIEIDLQITQIKTKVK